MDCELPNEADLGSPLGIIDTENGAMYSQTRANTVQGPRKRWLTLLFLYFNEKPRFRDRIVISTAARALDHPSNPIGLEHRLLALRTVHYFPTTLEEFDR
jgi:hypothetical protein